MYIDWWEVVLEGIKENFMYNHAYAPIGARIVNFTIKLSPGEQTRYKYTDYGVPNDAKILSVNYTPYSPTPAHNLFPLIVHGNNPTRPFKLDEVIVYPMVLGNDNPSVETEVGVFATWIPHTGDDISWSNIVSAFEAYVTEEYEEAIIPANVAVESKLTKFLSEYLSQFSGKGKAEDFLRDAATYSYQLNILIPLITSLSNLTKLPNHIMERLKELRRLRNRIAHDGSAKNPLNKSKVAELLCAALFGFRYIRLLIRNENTLIN